MKIDHKGRLKLSASHLATLGTQFFITSEDGEFVRIYPLDVWNEIEKQLLRLCLHNKNRQKLLARAKYFGRAVKMDRQGRVLIPAILRKSAQMRGEVDVLDYQNYVEVWNHTRFVHNLKNSPVTAQDESALNRLAG